MNFGAWQLLITIQCQCLKENSANIRPNISFCVWQKKEIIHVWNNMRMTIPLKVEMENCLSHLSDWEGKQLWIEAALSSWSKISTHPSKSSKNCFKSANADFYQPRHLSSADWEYANYSDYTASRFSLALFCKNVFASRSKAVACPVPSGSGVFPSGDGLICPDSTPNSSPMRLLLLWLIFNKP